MAQRNEGIIKKGTFDSVAYSSDKKYACGKGQLTLTSRKLTIDCMGAWTKVYRIVEIRLEAHDKILEVYDLWYGRLLLRLIVDAPQDLVNALEKIIFERVKKEHVEFAEGGKKRIEEWRNLLDIKPEVLKRLQNDIEREMAQFGRENLRFNIEIQRLLRILKYRKLKAYIVAHSYVVWYEWTKGLLYKIYKAKFGRGPENDDELITFLGSYPSLGILDTEEEWEIKANQIRNCVAHERFHYDYRHSEIVFVVNGKEKRIRLREIEGRLLSLSSTYRRLREFIKEKVETGEIAFHDI